MRLLLTFCTWQLSQHFNKACDTTGWSTDHKSLGHNFDLPTRIRQDNPSYLWSLFHQTKLTKQPLPLVCAKRSNTQTPPSQHGTTLEVCQSQEAREQEAFSEAANTKRQEDCRPPERTSIQGGTYWQWNGEHLSSAPWRNVAHACSGEDRNQLANLVKQALYKARDTPAWPHYVERLHLMGSPGELRDLIFSFVLPIDTKAKTQDDRNIIDLDHWPRASNTSASYVLPVLHTCRQIRYEYGTLLCERKSFEWYVPEDWDASRLTYFTQFAASLGCQNYHLAIHVHDVSLDGHQDLREVPGPFMNKRWDNMKQWAKDVYDGVGTRLPTTDDCLEKRVELDYRFLDRRHRGLIGVSIEEVLDEVQQAKDSSWPALEKRLEERWESNGRVAPDDPHEYTTARPSLSRHRRHAIVGVEIAREFAKIIATQSKMANT